MEWSQQLWTGLWQATPDAVLVSSPDGRVVQANDRAERLFGYDRGQLVGCPVVTVVPGATAQLRAEVRRRARGRGGVVRHVGLRARRRDGSEFPVEVWLSVVDTPGGEHAVVVLRDVSTRDSALASQVPLVAAIVQSSHDAIVSTDLSGRILTFNPGAERLYGWPADEIVGRHGEVLVPPQGRRDEHEIVTLVAQGARLERFATRRLHRDGRVLRVSLAVSPLTDRDGTIVGVVSTARDFSERERSEARLQAVLEAAPDAVIGADAHGTVVLVNAQAEQVFGRPRHDLLGQPITRLLPEGIPADRQPGPDGLQPHRVHRPDGTDVPVEITTRVLDTDDGPVTCAVLRDITRRLQAAADAERLRTEAAEQRLQARMHHSQRLESLGQLAGGVAHDFNNLLAVIVSYAELATDQARAAGPGLSELVADLGQITRAAGRGSELTHQLLAFARREVTRPRVLDLNHTIRDVDDMLRRSIGEHITLTTRLAEPLPAITADPGQLEQVLVNLAVNARDAMPDGGTLAVDTAPIHIDRDDGARLDLAAGDYVQLRITDTGTGMPREIADRAFEPFFTTKPEGRGTGLGLATVYGIIRQAGGTAQIDSEPGMGTTVTLLLPTTTQPAHPNPTEPAHQHTTRGGTGEHILLVEDQDALREITRRILITAGYHVHTAADPAAALTIAADPTRPIDLLLTDVVMPGMLGRQLAQHITETRPGTPVLYMSGYAQPVLTQQGTLDPDTTLVEKPFTRTEILTAIRQQLDQTQPTQTTIG